MNTEEKDIIKEILELIRNISKKASESSRKAYLGQFVNSFSFDDEINGIEVKINNIKNESHN